MRPGDWGVAAAVTKMIVLPLFSRAEQLPFKIPVHVPELHNLCCNTCWLGSSKKSLSMNRFYNLEKHFPDFIPCSA